MILPLPLQVGNLSAAAVSDRRIDANFLGISSRKWTPPTSHL